MIPFYLQLLSALVLDLLLGDPRWLPHPVSGIAKVAKTLESFFRAAIKNQYLAGFLTVIGVLGSTGGIVFGLIYGATLLHPLAGDLVSIYFLFSSFALRDLIRHSQQVYRALSKEDLPGARVAVGRMVGRDTENLDEGETVRAAVESVAENLTDGVTAPFFFAVLGGPVGALVYKAINTMDSLFGYKNETYLKFGRVAARLDDVANYLPARLTAPFIVFCAWFLPNFRAGGALRILLRDRRKHPSPNAGLTEASMAGALGVKLGGMNYYFGEPSLKPELGEPLEQLDREHILRTNLLTAVAAASFFILIGGGGLFLLGLMGNLFGNKL